MTHRIALCLLILLIAAGSVAQDSTGLSPEQFGLMHLSEYLGLKPSDISFRPDYTEPDSFRLQIISDLMERPLQMIDYTQMVKNAHVPTQPEVLAGILLSDLAGEGQSVRGRPYRGDPSEVARQYNLHYRNEDLNRLLTRAATYLNVIIPGSSKMMLSKLSPAQRKFLTAEFKELIVEHVEHEFFTVEQSDSVEKVEEGYAEEFAQFGYLIDPDPVIAAGIDCLREMVLESGNLRRILQSIDGQQMHTTTGYLPDDADREAYLGLQSGWKVGGFGNDYYEGDFSFILDLGGNDVYNLKYDPEHPHGVIIIDLDGDDFYRTENDFGLASGCLSVGMLLDFGGDDHYVAKSFALGSGFFGFGLLYDAEGVDRYDGDTHVEGAAAFGLGLLIDESGRDIYNAALYAQGFGGVGGIGLIYDSDGSDSYYAGGKYKDILRYEDHYLSLSQGFGYGVRPWMSGGIGAIIDLKGNDSYYSDIFAQAASYWWSLGFIYDSSGNDNYQSFQYAQGAATHMTLGILIDDYGSDVYSGKGLMHGCGHDYSAGILLDRHGNDTYTAYDLSQGAGSANGVGLLIDSEGDDRYFVKNPLNTQGYGNPRRDFGSIGLFIDLGGADQYLGNGRDNFYWRTDSKWGGGMDIELYPVDSSEGDR